MCCSGPGSMKLFFCLACILILSWIPATVLAVVLVLPVAPVVPVLTEESAPPCLAFNPKTRQRDLPGHKLGPNCYRPIARPEAQLEQCRGIAVRAGPSRKSCQVIGSFYDFAAPRPDQPTLVLGELYYQDGSWRDYFMSAGASVDKAQQQFETNCRINRFQCVLRATGGGPPGWFAVSMRRPTQASGKSPQVFLNGERGATLAVDAWDAAKQACEAETGAECWVVLIFWKENPAEEAQTVKRPVSR